MPSIPFPAFAPPDRPGGPCAAVTLGLRAPRRAPDLAPDTVSRPAALRVPGVNGQQQQRTSRGTVELISFERSRRLMWSDFIALHISPAGRPTRAGAAQTPGYARLCGRPSAENRSKATPRQPGARRPGTRVPRARFCAPGDHAALHCDLIGQFRFEADRSGIVLRRLGRPTARDCSPISMPMSGGRDLRGATILRRSAAAPYFRPTEFSQNGGAR